MVHQEGNYMVRHNALIKLPKAGDGARMTAWVALRRLMRENSTGAQDELSAAANAAKLNPRDVGLAFEMLMGVLRNRRLLDKALERLEGFEYSAMDEAMRDVLRLGAFQYLMLDRIPPHAVVSEMVDVAKARIGERAGGFANAALQQLLRQYDGEVAALNALMDELKPEERWSWPGWAARVIKRTVGEVAYESVLEKLNSHLPIYGRVNRLRARSATEVVDMLADTGLRAVERPEIERDVIEIDAPAGLIADNGAYKSGMFTVQDVSAQLIGLFVGARPEMTVVDYCAAPGGKSMVMASEMKKRGRFLACDLSGTRLERLEDNVLRMGMGEFVEMLNLTEDEITVEDWVGPNGADRVLVDAPCSGLGTLRRHPEIRWRLGGEDLRRLPELQFEVLDKAAALVAVGGVLVYGTCSFTREENESVVERFLEQEAGRFSIVPAAEGNAPDSVYPGNLSRDGWLRFPPGSVDCDSATAVRLRRLKR